MKVPKISSITEIRDLNKDKKQTIVLPAPKSSRITNVLKGLMMKSASALLPEVYAFHLTKKMLKNTFRKKRKTPEL